MMRVRPMHVFIAGGAGFLGSALVPCLLDAGHHVTVLDRFFFGNDTLRESTRSEPSGERLRLVRNDVRRITGADLAGVDAVVYLAAISNDPACELEPELTLDVNQHACLRLAALARERGVSRFVFASSCSVYGHGAAERLSEAAPLSPVSLYARCKANAERELLDLGYAGVSVLRFATLFGVAGRPRFDLAVNVMTKNAYVKRSIMVEGGGRQWRPFVHVRDAARAIQLVLEAEPARVSREIFNVGSDENNVRILTLAYRIRDAIPEAHIEVAPTDPDLRDYNVSFEKVRRVLDFSPRVSIEQGIHEVIDALRRGSIDPNERRCYTLAQYGFLAEVERTFEALSLDGKMLGLRSV